ncbi:MAG: hypothetical protein AAGB00_08465 [Planctomycetota bacterium]
MSAQFPADVSWKGLFENWPEGLSRRGIVVSTLNESMPFKGFMTRPDMVVLERQNPDSLGARFILLRYDGIASIKLTDPLKAADFEPLGFTGRFSIA